MGCSLYGRKRYEEFSTFLDWLVQTIENEKVDALLVAGDVFDTSTASDFSSGAIKETNQPDKTPVDLMNGEQLVTLLMEYNIGVRRM